ncbi:hypothetical protein EVX74_011330 [Acinetobacter lwoffii]|uniref:Uncharacterized protein n=1 Tax=Acinetobacter lwoffii TaxID=28090 RepID=A0AAJ4P2I5_ACILW|nr:hypothetical protein EVX74_011330 [Acinetobacter lwoffii]
MSKMLENYEAALQRLIHNKPTNPKLQNTKYKINKATVSIEAGRDPSSIRNDNLELNELRSKIKQAEIERKGLGNTPSSLPKKELKEKLNETKDEYTDLQKRYNILLVQVNSLIVENKRLKDELKNYIKKENLLPFK